MKTIVRSVISVLFVTGLVSGFVTTSAGAKTSQPSASGTYRFVLEDDFTKSVEFNATTDERGVTTGQMTFTDEAGVSEQDPDGVVEEKEEPPPPAPFYMTAVLDSLTIDRNRAVMGGTIADSSVRSYIGKWVQLVVEDNGDGSEDKLTWCFCQPEESGWVPADAEVPEDRGAFLQWWVTDAELEDDKGYQSPNIIPGNKTSCTVFALSTYEFADVRNGEGQIQVQP